MGKSTFMKRAELSPDFRGLESGVIVVDKGEMKRLVGNFHLPSQELVGGWARVHRRNLDVPFEKTVSLKEYNTGRSVWRDKPATMIEKVAIVQGLRESFPSSVGELIEQAELGEGMDETDIRIIRQDMEVEQVAEASLPPVEDQVAQLYPPEEEPTPQTPPEDIEDRTVIGGPEAGSRDTGGGPGGDGGA